MQERVWSIQSELRRLGSQRGSHHVVLLAFVFQHVLADSLAESSPFRAIQALQNRPHLATAFGMPTGPSRNDTGLLTVDRCRLSETRPECSDVQRVALQVKTSVVVRQAQDPHQPANELYRRAWHPRERRGSPVQQRTLATAKLLHNGGCESDMTEDRLLLSLTPESHSLQCTSREKNLVPGKGCQYSTWEFSNIGRPYCKSMHAVNCRSILKPLRTSASSAHGSLHSWHGLGFCQMTSFRKAASGGRLSAYGPFRVPN